MAFESSIDASLPSPPESLPDTEPWGTTSPAFLALQLFNDTSLPSPPKSLSDTETWGPTSPALLDVLDDPSEGRRQSDIPGEPLRDDLLDDCAESDDFATFGADHGTVASSRMGGQESVFPGPTHLKVEGHDEESFWAFAVKDFFKHNNVNPQERDVHTAVFREFFSMRDDLHHLHLLFETKLFCQIYNKRTRILAKWRNSASVATFFILPAAILQG
ncbi:hypothetical protein J7T55_012006 [Diaporthe amygdali]|uniref:uncharacterized protein n=1 Tax=Phomopsis amygdali TaxID=1214568 RepID=UPI0022FF3C4D|nr:uncharacterized protein J7T55_012006 [Diaporthe amygdali]KAJ0123541.1 hypothetical protein J7T55_012006 [Diaporthe amygdali]